jgi:hypothetical protein
MTRYLLAIILLLAPLDTPRADDASKGLALMQQADARDRGWVDARAELEMILRNRQGQESRRSLRIDSLEVAGDGDKSLTVFDSPRDIKGTAFLSFTHALSADEQWLFLPALKRVKRIASANKSGPFVGSEFAYEDITSQEVAKYTYRYLRDDRIDDRAVFVIEAHPAYANSGYTREIVWLDQTMYQPLKVEYFDRKNAALKVLELSEHQLYLDRYWRPGRMHMRNLQNGKSTELRWTNYGFQIGLDARDFDQNTLKRAR